MAECCEWRRLLRETTRLGFIFCIFLIQPSRKRVIFFCIYTTFPGKNDNPDVDPTHAFFSARFSPARILIELAVLYRTNDHTWFVRKSMIFFPVIKSSVFSMTNLSRTKKMWSARERITRNRRKRLSERRENPASVFFPRAEIKIWRFEDNVSFLYDLLRLRGCRLQVHPKIHRQAVQKQRGRRG